VILVSVGTHTAPFDRLVVAADEYARSVSEDVVIQRGVSRLVPRHARFFDFCTSAEFGNLIRESRVVVCQAADTVVDALRLRRPVVAVPRMRKYGEVINDHQVDFANALASRGWVHAEYEPILLHRAIDLATAGPTPIPAGQPEIARAIRRQIFQWFPET
jgi:UDP-N-acetylglucosamine transferase subunit ALG13